MSSYEINAPVDFTNTGEVQVTFSNTAATQVWSQQTSADSMVFGSTLTPNVAQLDPDGTSNFNVARLRSGILGIRHQADPGLVSNYTFNWPANPPTGDAQFPISSGVSNVFYEIHAQNTIFVRKNPGPGEFSSVAAAVASVVGATDSNRFLIWVYPGIYSEPNFIIPAFTYIVGVSMQNFIMEPSGSGAAFVTFSNNTGLAFATVRNTDPNYPALYFYNVGDYALTHKTEFEGCPRCVMVETDALATEESQVYLEYMGTTDSIRYAAYALDSGSSFANFVSIENFFTTGHSDDGMLMDGPQVEVISQSTVMQSDGTGTAFRLLNGSRLDLRGTYIEDWTKGIWVENTPGTPTVLAEGVIYENITQNNILIENTATQGYNDGYTQYSLTSIPYVSPFFVAGKDQRIVTVAKKGADFTSVAAAVAFITDNNVNNRYTVYVGPGVFVEPNIQMKSYVSIMGFYKTQTILIPSSTTGPFITGASYAALANLMLKGDNPAFAPTIASLAIQFDGDPAGVHFRVEDLVFDSFVQLGSISSNLGPCIFLVLSPLINVEAQFTKGFTFADSPTTHDPVLFYVNDVFWNPNSVGLTNFSSLFEVSSSYPGPGQNIYGVMQSSAFGHQPVFPDQGTAITVTGACNILIASVSLGGFQKCFYVPNSSASTIFSLTSVSCIASNTVDVDIQNPNASGSISGSFEYSKINIVTGASFGVVISDPNGSLALGGQIYQGERWNLTTNITEQIQHASTTGQVDGPNLLTTAGGLNINVPGGRGYVFLGPISDNYLKYILWSTTVLTLPDNALSWIYVDGNEVVQSSISIPSHIQNVVIGAAKTFGGSITYIQDIGTNINNLSSEIDDTLRNVFGPIVKSGTIGAPGSNLTAREIQISSGQYNLSVIEYFPGSQDPISMLGYYNSGNSQTALFTDVPLQYDNAGVLTNIPSGQWAKHAVYVLTAISGSSQYFLVYAQQLYASEALTVDGNLPAPPPFFIGNMCPFTAVIVSGDDTNAQLPLSRFLDIRPTLSFTASSSTATLDHNSLLNLTVGNPHTQYFMINGSEPMAGNFDLSTYNIVGSGTPNLIFGMNILQHASRHLPGGADPLATAAPVTISALSNQEGVAASFARSDHLHAHGVQTDSTLHALATSLVPGFMPASDKAKLDAATTSPTANTIVIRDASSYISSRGLTLYNNAGSFFANILPSPSTFLGPNHTLSVPIPATDDSFVMAGVAQTLTNKTITDSTNTVYSRSFFVGPSATVSTDSAGVPTTGQVLYASSTSAAGWVTVNNAFLAGQGVSFTVTAGTGLTGGGSVSPGGSVSLAVNGVSSFVGNRVVLSTASGFTELSALTNGQLVIGRTGLAPVAGSLTSTSSTITVTPGAGTLNVDLPNVVTGGAYTFPSSLTVDNYGRITSITSGGAGGGTVTSVGLAMPSIFSVTGSPVTTSGTLVVTSNTQTANTFYAGPSTGPVAVPTFRSITNSDLPSIVLTGGAGVTGTLPVANGGTGTNLFSGNRVVVSNAAGTALTTLAAATDGQIIVGSTVGAPVFATLGVTSPIVSTVGSGSLALSLTTIPVTLGGTGITTVPTSNQILLGNGVGGYVLSTLTAGTNISIITSSGTTTVSLTGIVPVANGGTGASSFTGNSLVISNAGGTALASLNLGLNQIAVGTAGAPTTGSIAGTTNQVTVSSGPNFVASLPTTLIAPGSVSITGSLSLSTSASVAAAGTTQGTATPLSSTYNVVTSGTGSANGVKLPAASTGLVVTVVNRTGVVIFVYPFNTEQIDAATSGSPVTIQPLSTMTFEASSASQWYTIVREVGALSPLSAAYGNGTTTISLTGTVPVANGGTGVTSTPTNGQLLIGNGTGYTLATLTPGTAIGITNGSGSITIGVTTVPVANGGTGANSFTANSVVISGNTTTSALSSVNLGAGQVLIGTTSSAPTAATLTAGTGISISSVSGSITISLTTPVSVTNGGTGVTSLTGNGVLTVNSGGTALVSNVLTNGQILIGSTGLAPVVGSITGTSPITVTGGAGTITVALSTVPVSSGGTGAISFTANSVVISGATGTSPLSSINLGAGQILIGTTSAAPTATTLTAGTGISISSVSGSITISLSTPVSVANGGTGATSFTGNSLIVSNSGGTALTALSLTTDQIAVGTAGAPTAGSVAGTTNQINVSAGPNFVSSLSSTLVLPGSLSLSTSAAVSASGTTQGTSNPLNSTFNVVTSATAGSATGVRLPVATTGMIVTVVNRHASVTIVVYPQVGSSIDGVTNIGINIPPSLSVTFEAFSATQWASVVRQINGSTNISVSNSPGTYTVSLTGTVPVSNGGTGAASFNANSVVISGATGTSALSSVILGAGQLLIGTTSAAPTAATLTAGTGISISSVSGSVTISLSTPVTIANGGTGVTALTANGIITSNGTTLASNVLTNGQILIGSTGLAPVVGSISGTSPITVTGGPGTITLSLSTVPVASGGTGVISFPANSVVVSSSPGTNPLSAITFSNTNQVLAYNGTAPVAGSITGTANQIDITTGPNFVSSISSALTLPGSLSVSTANTLTATGTNSATALPLSATYNIVTSVPAGTGVKLPTVVSSTVGMVVTIVNKGANPVIVYPDTGATIDGLGSVNVSSGSTLTFGAASAALWYVTVRQVLAISPLSATLGSGTTSISLTGTVPVANGGTGVTTTPSNGQLLIGNGTGYTVANLSAGSGVSITNGAGSIQISATASTAFTTCLYAVQLVVTSAVANTFAFFPWPSAYTTTYTTTRTVRFWLDITDITKGITLTVTYGPTNVNILTYTNTAITSALISQTFTAPPAADTYLSFTIVRAGGGGGGANSASIKGITLVLA